MSIKSNRELEGQLELAHRYRVLSVVEYQQLTDETILIRKKTYTLRKKVLGTEDTEPPASQAPQTPNPKPSTPDRNTKPTRTQNPKR